MPADTAPETRPRRATTASTLSHAICDADHILSDSLFGPRHFCSPHDAHRISCRVNRSPPRGFRWAHARQPPCNLGPTRRPECRRYSRHVARRRRMAGEARDKGVPYYSHDPGRVQRGRRDNEADRDVTVIPVIPGRHSYQERCRGAGRDRRGIGSAPAAERRRSGHDVGPRVEGAGTARSPVPVAHDVLLSSSGHLVESPCPVGFLAGSLSSGPSPVPVAHRRSFRSTRVSAVGRGRGSRCAAVPFARVRAASPGPVAHRVPPRGTAGT